MGPYSMGRGATFFRLRYVVYCPSLGSSARPVFIHRLSQIACMSGPSIEQGIPSGVSSRSENSGVAELKEDGQVSCDTAQNLRLTFLYITPHARAAARPHAGASTSLAFSCSISV